MPVELVATCKIERRHSGVSGAVLDLDIRMQRHVWLGYAHGFVES